MKEKIIAEMQQELINWAIKKDLCFSFDVMRQHAEVLYKAGYRKVPEGGCVLSKEEYSDYLIFKNDYAEVKEQCAKRQADNERLYNNLAKFKKSVETETARDILQKILLLITCWDGRNVHINHDELVEFGKKYDVDLRVVEE